jgi:NAD-specific glutamate dehydrogenase
MPDGGKVKIASGQARGKIAQIREMGKKTLNAEDYAQLEELLAHWAQYGMSAYLNYQLGRLMAKMAGADIEVSESPEWEEVWI